VDFYRDKSKKDGYRNICKECDKEKDRLDKLYPPIKIDYNMQKNAIKKWHFEKVEGGVVPVSDESVVDNNH
jgi:hypothetical protein